MIKLMKYEFRKAAFSKLVLLVITAIAEAAFLAGVFLEWDKGLSIGITCLGMCAFLGVMYIGIESLLIFHKDLNTKQSYMLFLTPRNSFQVLGAKVLSNGFSILFAGLFFAALAAVNFTIGVVHIGGLKAFLDLIREMAASIHIDINVPPQEIIGFVLLTLFSWVLMIVTGYLAIILSATVFAGKRFSGFVSFLVYILLMYAISSILNLIPDPNEITMFFYLSTAAIMGMVVVVYLIAGWIMERKLSV